MVLSKDNDGGEKSEQKRQAVLMGTACYCMSRRRKANGVKARV